MAHLLLMTCEWTQRILRMLSEHTPMYFIRKEESEMLCLVFNIQHWKEMDNKAGRMFS